MIVNLQEKLKEAMVAVLTAWNGAMTSVKTTLAEWVTVIPSTTSANNYHWVELLVQIRKKIGPRVIGNLRAQKWTVENEEYEGTYGIRRTDLEDDNLGLLAPQAQNLYGVAQNHWESLAFQAELDGFSKACYDGQFFIDTDHPALTDDGTTVSNHGTAAFDDQGVALKEAVETFWSITGPSGEVLDLEPYEVHVGPSNYWKALALYEKSSKPGGAGEDNELKGRYKPRINPKFVGAYAAYWTVLARFRGTNLGPIVVQQRLQPELATTMINQSGGNDLGIPSEDYQMFNSGDVLIGSRQRGAATFTFWALEYGSDGSVA